MSAHRHALPFAALCILLHPSHALRRAAIVTGGSRGIGRGISEALAADGGALDVPEEVCSALTYFSSSLLDDLRRLRVRRFSARRRSTPETMSMYS